MESINKLVSSSPKNETKQLPNPNSPSRSSSSLALTPARSDVTAAADLDPVTDDLANLVMTKTEADGQETQTKDKVITGKPNKNKALLNIPCDYYEFQQMQWRSEIILDEFDQDNVPYSPNLHKMWVRHCQRLQKIKDEEEESQNVKPAQVPQPPPTFPGFHYRPEVPDVVYENGNGSLLSVGGSWILNDKDELVSGPVPLTSSSMMQQQPHHHDLSTRGGHTVFNPFLNYPMGRSQPEEGNTKMRNRCYSDNQNGSLDYSSACKSSNDSGIDVEGEGGGDDIDHIAATPSEDEFKPPLNSTPQRNGGNVASSSGISQFLRKFQKLEMETRDHKDGDEEDIKEDNKDDENDEICSVTRLL